MTAGIGAIFYVEYGRQLFPKPGEGDQEENRLTSAMGPVVYWLVLFSIIVHGNAHQFSDVILWYSLLWQVYPFHSSTRFTSGVVSPITSQHAGARLDV